MKILINERLSEHRCKTPEGYLICTDAILARTGKQTYRKNEIFKDSDDETEIEVDRTEDEVFSPQTLASFENKPVTVEHPDEDVNVHNYKEYAVGFVRDVRRGDANGQPVILGNLVITDEQTIQEIENGEHTDLSCGYDCDIADEANPCQRNIRGNHVALCECGRAGIARIVDSTCDANRLPAKVKRDLQKFLNLKSTFIRNKDYDIAEFVKEFERVSRLWAEFPLKIVRESIKGWFKTGDGMMRKDYIFSIEGYDDRFMVSIYAKPDTYETTELNAYFTDSVKDTRMKVANLTNGYAIVPASRWRKFGLNSEVERFTTSLNEARYIRSSLERNDGISFVIVDVTQRRTTDSMKDAEEYAKKNTSDFRIAEFDSIKDSIIKTMSLRGSIQRGDIGKIQFNLIKENSCWISIEGLYQDDKSGLINIRGRSECVLVKKNGGLTVNVQYVVEKPKSRAFEKVEHRVETSVDFWKDDVIDFVEKTYDRVLNSVKAKDSTKKDSDDVLERLSYEIDLNSNDRKTLEGIKREIEIERGHAGLTDREANYLLNRVTMALKNVKNSTSKFDVYELRDIYGRDWDEGLEKEFPNLKVHRFAYFGEVTISGPDAELNKLQKRVKYKDSVNDKLIPPTEKSINKFESLLRTSNVEIDKKGLTTFGRVHYQVRAIMPFDQFVKTLDRIDNEMNKLGIPMTFSANTDGEVCTAGIDLDKQYVKDSQRAQKIQKIVKVVKSIK